MLSQYPIKGKVDFRYNRKGEYHNLPASNIYPRKKGKGDTKLGKLCPSCGMTRSLSNKCECNS